MPYKEYDLGQRSFLGYEPAACLDEDDPAFLVREFVAHLDLSGIKSHGEVLGQPAYHPAMMLSILIYGMLRGIFSSRALEAALGRDMGFIYLAAGQRPCFKTICNFRNSHAEAIRSLMAQSLAVMRSMGLSIAGCPVLDSSRIRAAANRDKMIRAADFEEAMKDIEAWERRSSREDEQDDERWGEENGYLVPKSVMKSAERRAELKKAIKDAQAQGRKAVSPVDTECAEMRESNTGRIRPGYALQVAVDKASGLITVCDAVNEQYDNDFTLKAVEQHEQNTGEKPHTLDADSGYYESGVMEALEKAGIDACIPDSNTAAALFDKRRKDKAKQAEEPNIGINDFEPIEGQDAWTCPEGHTLKPAGEVRRKGVPHKRYRARQDCRACPLASRCLRKDDNGRRIIEVSQDHLTIRRNQERFKDEAHRKRYKKRGSFIERIFGHLRRNLRFVQWLERGLAKVKTTATLFALAFNIMVLGSHRLKTA